MKSRYAALMLGLCVASTTITSHAQTSPWSLHAGIGHVRFLPSADLWVAGRSVPGADVGLDTNTTVAIEVAYDLDPRWSLRMALGVPPTTALRTAGGANALVPPATGKLGQVKYAPLSPSITYRLLNEGPVRPYVGLGITYMKILSTQDGDLEHLKVDSASGGMLQMGADLRLTARWSAFFDVRKTWLNTTATGNLAALGGMPVRGEVRLRPTVVIAGLGYRF